ncbi:NAD(P)H-quinone oxidoreductase [Pseudomonas sp. FME51]|uniref:NAD(P)H-quinone oxidoreductase n=1 Tax=Pseudomonas sp. FME51 TaxID=2742609 RepID=UPI001D033A9C|nr:NAD(P)H-quinone oxidoreductase [Pseudomonas sp. FME51]
MEMQAIEITEPGGPDVLRLTRRPVPVPGQGEVLIRVSAFGINRPDIAQRKGNYPVPPGVTDIPGLEVSGEIIAGDLSHPSNYLRLAQGDAVCALLQGGGYAEYCVAPIAQCLPHPAGFDHVQAAALPETFYTVWSNVFERGALGRGPKGKEETLLVHGGSSGIGTVAIQLAVQRGHKVFATAGSREKCEFCEALGATRAINYREEDFATAITALTDGVGVDVILDMVGGDYLPKELACAADDGRIVIIALQKGAEATIPLSDILRRRVTITGSTLRPRSVEFKGELSRELHSHVWPLLEQGVISPIIETVLPASEIIEAHRLMDAGAHKGKILLSWSL